VFGEPDRAVARRPALTRRAFGEGALLGRGSLVIYAAVFAQVRRAAAHVRVRRTLLRCAGVALIAFGLRVATEPAP
jgi:threonine/homoserine/homoserine lactone efflux protein